YLFTCISMNYKKTRGSGLFLGMIFGLLFFFVATGNFCGIRVCTKVRNFEGNFFVLGWTGANQLPEIKYISAELC
ncbi:MAG TPA: hypothetical protein VIJ27_13445, partial [Mucilaginibacter sp.]